MVCPCALTEIPCLEIGLGLGLVNYLHIVLISTSRVSINSRPFNSSVFNRNLVTDGSASVMVDLVTH